MNIWETLAEATSSSDKWKQNRARWAAHKQGRPEGRFNSEMSPFHGKMDPTIQKVMDDLATALDKDPDRTYMQTNAVLEAFTQLADVLVQARTSGFKKKMGYDKPPGAAGTPPPAGAK